MILEICVAVFDVFLIAKYSQLFNLRLLCNAKGLLLEGKRTTVGRQKDYSWKVKVVFLQGNVSFLRSKKLLADVNTIITHCILAT